MRDGSMTYMQSFVLKSGLELKNRILMAPMTTRLSFQDGDVTKDELDYYALRSGQVGAVITGAANVSDIGKGWEGERSIASDDHIPSLVSLANAIQINGTKAIIQLFHAGRMTNSKILRGKQPVSASAIAAKRKNAEIPRELSDGEIYEVINDFIKAVIRSYEAGFDGVELHGANTYLIQQFFSPHSNRRDDKWGGSLEKRYTFIEKLVDGIMEVKENFTRPFAVGYRFSPEEYEIPGISLEDTLYLIDKLSDKGLDYLHISLNDYNRKSISKSFQDHSILNYIHNVIAGRTPLIGVGGVQKKADLNNVLEHSELVAIGRALIIEPDWVSKVFNNRQHLIKNTVAKESFSYLQIPRSLATAVLSMMKDEVK